jgi:hypothetical protein
MCEYPDCSAVSFSNFEPHLVKNTDPHFHRLFFSEFQLEGRPERPRPHPRRRRTPLPHAWRLQKQPRCVRDAAQHGRSDGWRIPMQGVREVSLKTCSRAENINFWPHKADELRGGKYRTQALRCFSHHFVVFLIKYYYMSPYSDQSLWPDTSPNPPDLLRVDSFNSRSISLTDSQNKLSLTRQVFQFFLLFFCCVLLYHKIIWTQVINN